MPDEKSTNKAKVKRDPEGVKQNILRVATKEFAQNGLSGSRIDEIAAKTKTSKRMLYYYFGDKIGLYKKCLEASYARIRRGEEELDLDGLSPIDALAKLIDFTFEHHVNNPDFIRMVMIENVHDAKHLKESSELQSVNNTTIIKLKDIIQRGQKDGSFRDDLDPLHLHWYISALCFFNVSNQGTFSALFGNSLFSQTGQGNLRTSISEMLMRYVRNYEANT